MVPVAGFQEYESKMNVENSFMEHQFYQQTRVCSMLSWMPKWRPFDGACLEHRRETQDRSQMALPQIFLSLCLPKWRNGRRARLKIVYRKV